MADPKDTANQPTSKLFHSSLEQVPSPIRFALSGILGNVFFVIVYNICLASFQNMYDASAIYATVQFSCIVVNHFLNCGLVFGFPSNYVASLAQNMPVGLSALLLGAMSIKYLDRIQFDSMVEGMLGLEKEDESSIVQDEKEAKGFYASLVVMAITGVYSYILLNIVNKPSATSKETATGNKEKEL